MYRKVLGLIKYIKADHEENYGLSTFKSKKTVGKVTKYDHHPVILTPNLSIPLPKVTFTLRISKANIFFYITCKTSKISDTITTRGQFKNQVAKWEKLMKRTCLQAFQKSSTEKGIFGRSKLVSYL